MPQQATVINKESVAGKGFFTRNELNAIPLLPIKDGKVRLDRNNPEHQAWLEDNDE